MPLYLNTNLSALSAQRSVAKATSRLDKSYENLSSGYKINSAKDDPAGVQISDRLTKQINSLSQSNRNAQNAIAYAQTAEGAIDEITNMLQRIRTLAVQAATGTVTSEDRTSLQQEVDELTGEINRIARDTTFGGSDLLSGNASVAIFQIGANAGSNIRIDLSTGFDISSIAKMASQYTGSVNIELPKDATTTASYAFSDIFSYNVNGGGINISTMSQAQIVLAGIDSMISAVDSKRSELGAIQNRLEATVRNQDNIKENVSDSRSYIRDSDYAEDVSVMTAMQIQQQSAVSILTQANTKPQIALNMLQNSQ